MKKIIISITILMTVAISFSINAQTKNTNQTKKTKMEKIEVIKHNNPFGLVYDGAITENIKGKVNINPVSYQLKGSEIVANVYTPASYDESKNILQLLLHIQTVV